MAWRERKRLTKRKSCGKGRAARQKRHQNDISPCKIAEKASCMARVVEKFLPSEGSGHRPYSALCNGPCRGVADKPKGTVSLCLS